MALNSLVQLLGLAVFAFGCALLALWVLSLKKARLHTEARAVQEHPSVFLFENDVLINATPHAKGMLGSNAPHANGWETFLAVTKGRYPNLPKQVSKLKHGHDLWVTASCGHSRLHAVRQKGLLKIEILDSNAPVEDVSLSTAHFQAMEAELTTLRATAESAPYLVWRQDSNGTITWANNTYLALSQSTLGESKEYQWPPTRILDVQQPSKPDGSRRLRTHIAGEAEPRWFDCFEIPLGDESLFTAVSADNIVSAEAKLRDFIQTLTMTFAHLTVGLAIFDKQRRLTLFNPALTDLTGLSAVFLSGRPTFQSVLDHLREKQMIPEPKNYKSWRRRLDELEVAAVNGTYEETWSLANGQTYRVTGRPHPDGAVAFLFEDISAEISSTRRFRTELKTGQAVLDSLDQAVAVFSQSGSLMTSNRAYGQLWGVDPTSILGNFGIFEATQTWASKCAPTPVWGDAREFVVSQGDRVDWSDTVIMTNGCRLLCCFKPIFGGATVAEFSPIGRAKPGLQSTNQFQPDAPIEVAAI